LIQIKKIDSQMFNVRESFANGLVFERRKKLSEQPFHPMGPHHLPFYIVAPGETDVLMVVTGIFLAAAVFGVGILYWHLHSLPERMAHKTQKLQFEIVAVLGLLSLFTHNHLYWIAGLILALIEIPDFGSPLRSIAGSVEKIADSNSTAGPSEATKVEAAPAEAQAGASANSKVTDHA
jgi:hypothetical protein